MINSIYDLLVKLKENGLSEIEPFADIPHNPTIGDMFEGLTKDILEKSIFQGLDLKVTSGMIQSPSGAFSRQIDCMLVVGEGKNIAHTDEYVYDILQVVAVIEVKKNLFSNDLKSAATNLSSVTDITVPPKYIETALLRQAFEKITGKLYPQENEVKNLTESEQMIYHALVVNSYMPARIIFGYQGLKDENSLREKFINYLAEGVENKSKGYTPTSLPNLIICGENSLLKTDGLPYISGFHDSNEWWVCYASYNQKPLLLLLEIIWTKISMYFGIDIRNLLDLESEIEIPRPLLRAKGHLNKGWEYTYDTLSKEELAKYPSAKKWEPLIVGEVEFAIINHLCETGTITIDDSLHSYVNSKGEVLNTLLSRLSNERFISVDGNKIHLLTYECACIIYDGNYYIGENKDGQMTNWVIHQKKNL